MVEHETFNGILMDLQMPGMDGYQTASLIREKSGCKDIPIIAMSAAVMEEDKQKCISVGMVDHIAKPIMPEALVGALLKWVKPSKQGFAAAPPGAALEGYTIPLNLPGFNILGALTRIGGNKKLLCTLLHKFADDYSSVMERLDTLARSGDTNGVLMILHSLRGIAGSLGVSSVYDHAIQLQNTIKAGQFPVSFEALNQALQEAFMVIAQEVKNPERQINPPIKYDQEDAAHCLNELVSYLKKQAVYPMELLADLTSRLQPNVNAELLSELSRHVDNLNYKGALGVVGKIAVQLNIPLNL